MDIIGHLTRTVTPAVLGDAASAQNKNLLEQFYALFAAKLADNDTYNSFSGQEIARDDHSFFDRVWTDESHRGSITRELAASNDVDENSVKALVAAAAPLTLHELKSLAGTTPVPQFLRDNLSTYQQYIPAWATSLLPAGLLGAGAGAAATTAAAAHVAPAGQRISDTTSTAPLQREKEEEGGSFLKALLPIIGLIILGALAWALLKGCQDNPEPVAAPVEEAVVEEVEEPVAAVAPVAEVEPAVLTLASGDGDNLYACRISAGNDDLNNTIMASMNNVFAGEADKCRADIDDNFATDMPAAQYLDAILPLVKATPSANMIIKGDEILVNSPNQDELDKLVADLKAAAPTMTVVAEGPLDLQGEIQNSISAAEAAFNKLTDNPDPRDVARALSLQVINFEVDKAIIPDVNKPLLDRAVELMQRVPDMKLMILGHTDAQASNAYNMDLSQRRAEAVREYLVSQGADPEKLMTKGMGETDPIATNETEQGRFRNRRIEFTVYDEDMTDGIVVAGDTTVGAAETDDALPDGDQTVTTVDIAEVDTDIDPDLNPLDENNDDLLPDEDDTVLN